MRLATTNRSNPRRRKGSITTLFTLTLFFVVVPMVGLAIDAGLLFAIKAKLQTSTDGAALAAARSLSRGLSLGAQQGSATATAQKFFDANIQNGWLGLSNPSTEITFPAAPPKTTIVQIDTAVNANTYFMRMFGVTHVTLHARGAATRRDVNVEVVLDRSGSLANSSSCTPMKSAAISFIQSFVNGRDRLGLVTFGTTYRSDFDPATDFQSRGGGGDMVTMVNNIACVGGTNAAAAYWLAYQKLLALNEPGALNVILFFTDGQPNTLHMPAIQIKNPGSTCTDKTAKNGVLTPAGASIWGIFLAAELGPPPAPNPDWRVVAGSANCGYNSNFANVPNDVVSLAQAGAANEVDVNGNSLTGWKAVTRDGNGRISLNATNVTNAGINALDNAAARMRTESTANGLWVVTYCVGLGNAASPPEMALLQRISNVPESPTYNQNQPVGMLAYADNANQLQAMFMQLASDILRLSM